MRRERESESERKQHPLPAQKEPSGEEKAKKEVGEPCVKYISRRKMYLLGGEEEEANAAAICRENERMRKVSVSDGGGGGGGQEGSLGAKVEKVIAVEAGTCSADAAEQRVNMHDRIQLCFHANMGFN